MLQLGYHFHTTGIFPFQSTEAVVNGIQNAILQLLRLNDFTESSEFQPSKIDAGPRELGQLGHVCSPRHSQLKAKRTAYTLGGF